MENAQVVRMGYVIQDFLEEKKAFDATPGQLMEPLIAAGFFSHDIREGKPLRDVLRKLDDNDMLYLLPQLRVDRMEVNRQWFFNIYHSK